MDSKEYAKSLVGKRAECRNKKGVLKRIAFTNKDYSTCYFSFKTDIGGEHLVSIDDIKILNQQLILF